MTYAIDFDGIIYDGKCVVDDVIKKINELRKCGDKVVLHTSRDGQALKNALDMLEGRCEFDEVVSGKFYADAYVDDRNMSLDDFLKIEEIRMIRENREYRNFTNFEVRKDEGEEFESYVVRGYASTFDEYVLFKDENGTEYKEKIDPHAFDEADMTDVIFLYNHEGMVYARIKNDTLKCSIDEHGLYTEADLRSTEASREIYDSIKTGLIDQMSFAFTVKEDKYDQKTHTRTVLKIDKVYDVSAVSIPANPGTDITTKSARSYFDGVIEAERAERLEREKQLQLVKAKYEFLQ